MLVVLALGDMLIAIAHATGHAEWSGRIISTLAALVVANIGLLSQMRDISGKELVGKMASPRPQGWRRRPPRIGISWRNSKRSCVRTGFISTPA